MARDKNNTHGVTDGHYILSHDVVNPKPDRRTRRDFRFASTWKKGLRIRVKERSISYRKSEGDMMDRDVTWLEMTPYGSSLSGYNTIHDTDEHRRFEAIAAALEPAEDGVSLAAEAKEEYVELSEIIDELIGNGESAQRLTVDDIRAIILSIKEKNEREYEEAEARRQAENEALLAARNA